MAMCTSALPRVDLAASRSTTQRGFGAEYGNRVGASACASYRRPSRMLVSGSETKEVEMAKAKSAVPAGHHTVTPHLVYDNAAQAIEWYKKGLGAEEVARAVGPDGKILHAEIRVGNSLI